MSVVNGQNIKLYVSGDASNGLFMVGCEQTCSVEFTSEIILTTSRGSGKFNNREYGLRDVTITSDGVIFLNASANPSTNANPLWFASSMLEGKKCVCKFEISDGTNTGYYIGKFIIQRAQYTGDASELATYSVTLLNDGDVVYKDSLKTLEGYNNPSVFLYTAGGVPVDGFSSVSLENADIYFIYRYGLTTEQLFESIQTLSSSIDLPTGTGTVGFHAASGTVNFEAQLVSGDFVLVVYNAG